MLLGAELLLESLYLSETVLAEVVRLGSHPDNLLIKRIKLRSSYGNLLLYTLFARRGSYQSHFALHFEKLGVDRFALRFLTCIDEAAI